MKVSVEGLSMSFDDAGHTIRIFSALSFQVNAGDSIGIIGRSGVGKTTLLNLIGGLDIPVEGDVRLGDQYVSELRKKPARLTKFRGQHIGFVFQSHYLLPEFDSVENVAMPLLIQGVSRGEAFTRAREILAKVGLANRETHRPGMLSGGEQQRVAIARSLVAKPGVVLADEPTGSLDRQTAEEVGDLLLEMHRDSRFTLIVVTHSPELAGRLGSVMELTRAPS